MPQILDEFGLVSTYQTLEGCEALTEEGVRGLMQHAMTLAKDQGGCRFLQQ